MRPFRLIGAVIWAIPAFFLWNYLAPIYLPQLPAQYLDVPFWHVAGMFVLVKIVSMMIFGHRFGHFSKFKKFRHFAKRCGGMSETYYHN